MQFDFDSPFDYTMAYKQPVVAPQPQDDDDDDFYLDKGIVIDQSTDALWAYSSISYPRGVPCVSFTASDPFPFIMDPRLSERQFVFFRRHLFLKAKNAVDLVDTKQRTDFDGPIDNRHQLALCEGFYVGPDYREQEVVLTEESPVALNNHNFFPAYSVFPRENLLPGGVFATHMMGNDTGVAYSGLHLDFATSIAKAMQAIARIIINHTERDIRIEEAKPDGDINKIRQRQKTARLNIVALLKETSPIGGLDKIKDWQAEGVSVFSQPNFPAQTNDDDRACFFFPVKSFIDNKTNQQKFYIPKSPTARIAISHGAYLVRQGKAITAGVPQTVGNDWVVIAIKGVTESQWFSIFTCKQCDDIRFATRIRFYELSPGENWTTEKVTTQGYNNRTFTKDEDRLTKVRPNWGQLSDSIGAKDPFSFWRSLYQSIMVSDPRPQLPPVFFAHFQTVQEDRKIVKKVVFDDRPTGVPIDAVSAWYLFGQYLKYPILFPPSVGVPYQQSGIYVCSPITITVNKDQQTVYPGEDLYDKTHFGFPRLIEQVSPSAILKSVEPSKFLQPLSLALKKFGVS